nr:hypothetical protein DGKKSRWO_DGKKSRWO_CDS_0024 [uncultured phage]CAI9752145.1 hypothetical protein CVNMHQAP_CVNMHQAP_CDS_0024 [uncultured phage]
MATTKLIDLTLDNLTYSCVVNKDDVNLVITLPKGVTSQSMNKVKDVYTKSAEQIEIKLFIFVNAAAVPSIIVRSNKQDVKIYGGSSIALQPNTCQMVSFVTPDGGNTWVVSGSSFAELELDEIIDSLNWKIVQLSTRTENLENAGFQTEDSVKTLLTKDNYVKDAKYITAEEKK